MYSVHGVVNGYTRKDEAFYRNMLIKLRDHATDCERKLVFNPQLICSDFEIAFMNAAKDMFPNSNLHVCLFNFSQNLWKNAVNKGLKTHYSGNPVVKDIIRFLLAMPFVPLQDINETFELIVEKVNNSELEEDVNEKNLDLVNFIERSYVRKLPARGRWPAVVPRFHPEVWNCYDLVRTKTQRITNNAEGWHSKFQRITVSHHSGIWKFLENLKKDQSENEIMMNQLLMGHTRIPYPVKGQYKRNQEFIEVILGNYNNYKEEGNILTYLLTINYKKLQIFRIFFFSQYTTYL